MERKDKIKILNVLFWVFLTLGVGMLIWKLVGNSPDDFEVYIPLLAALFFKLSTISETIAGIRGGLRSDIPRIKADIKELKKDVCENKNGIKENRAIIIKNKNKIEKLAANENS